VNKPAAKTAEKVIPKKVFKISIEFYPGGKSKIYRKDLSALIDKTDNSVAWLKAHDFKEEDIELLGTVPDCWETYYPAPVVVPNVVESAPLVEKIAEVLAAPVAVETPMTPDPIEQALSVEDVQTMKLEAPISTEEEEALKAVRGIA
jgi:hypothetical protein